MGESNLNDLKHSNLQYDGWRQAEKSITFVGETTNGIGDHDGTGDPFDIFTVTGTVKTKLYAICTTSLSGNNAMLSVGVSGGPALLIANTSADEIDANDIWHDIDPDASVELDTVAPEEIIANGKDIIGSVGTSIIEKGVIKFICLWKPITKDGNVVPA